MDQTDWLAQQFERHRAHLWAVALRLLGSAAEAEDAVQEAWLRLSRSDAERIDNLGGWLTTVVSRVSLDMLRSRASRREEQAIGQGPAVVSEAVEGDPEYEAVLADSLGPALLVVLGTLKPAERLAFVLHDMFGVPFDEIATVLGRSPNATKMLASRARRRVQGSEHPTETDAYRQREVVDAFLAASRSGNFDALLALLDPDVVLRADAAAVAMGSPEEVHGAAAVAGVFSGRALGAQPALVDGAMALAWAPGGQPKVVWELAIHGGHIVRMDMVAAPASLGELDLVLFES